MSELIDIETMHRVKPGETLVVKLDPSVSSERMQEIVRELETRISDGVKLLVLGGDIGITSFPHAEADQIADAVRKATENPGKTFEVEK